MKLYKTKNGIVAEKDEKIFLFKNEAWDSFINDDDLLQKTEQLIEGLAANNKSLIDELLPPIGSKQELWACGVTYLRSKVGRQEESKASGGAAFTLKFMKPKGRNCFLNQRLTGLLATMLL